MNTSADATDLVSTQGVIEPVAGASTYTTGWFDAGTSYSWLATVIAGTVGTSVDAKIQQAVDSSGTSAKDVSSAAITQLVAAGSAQIEFHADDLDISGDFDHIRLSITTVGATTVAGGLLQATCPKYAPLAAGSKVDETVTV